MKTAKKDLVIHQADSRGYANHGWLLSRHTFSFANYYNPERNNFGLLRVLNDDIIQPGMGFGKHPHDNMEIISIPIYGALEHKDSTGKSEIIESNEVQIMSAGSGIWHSEYNASKSHPANFLQIWIFPKLRNIEPRYDQKVFDDKLMINQFVTLVSPEDEKALWINQDAFLSMAILEDSKQLTYNLHKDGNGIYIFLIDGKISVADHEMNSRDALGITETQSIDIRSNTKSKILVIEVPMNY